MKIYQRILSFWQICNRKKRKTNVCFLLNRNVVNSVKKKWQLRCLILQLGFSCSTLSTKHVCPLLLPCFGPFRWALKVSEGVCDGFPASVSPSNTLALFFYWVTVRQSGVLLLKSFNLSTAWLHRTHHSTQTHTLCAFHTQDSRLRNSVALHACTLSLVAYAWVLSLFVSAYYFTVYEHTENKFPWLPPTISLRHGSHTPLRAAGWCLRGPLSCHLAIAVHWHCRVARVCMWQTGGWVAG